MHFTRHGEGITPPIITRGEGVTIWDDKGKSYIDGLSGLFVVQVGHGRKELAEAAAKQAEKLAFFPLWSYAHPPAIELAERLAGLRARRPEPRLLHHRRRRGRRDRLEAGQAVLQADRQARQAQGDLARRSPTTAPRRARCRSPASRRSRRRSSRSSPGAFRVPNTNFYRAPEHRARRPQGVRPLGRRPHRRGDRVRGPRHRRRGLPRAGAELRRLLPAAARLLRAGPRDLRRVRRAARLRRGDLRLRPDRLDVRLRRLRLRARHHHLRQGHDLGLLPDRRDDRQRPAVRAVQRRARRRSRTATPSAGTRCRRRSRWPTSTSSSARASTTTSSENAPAFRATLEKLLDLPIVGDVRGDGLLLRHRAGQGQGDQGDLRRRRVASGCCAASCPRRCSRPACTAAPTTAATRSSSWRRR